MVKSIVSVLFGALTLATWFGRETIKAWFFEKVVHMIEPDKWLGLAVEYGPPLAFALAALWLLLNSRATAPVATAPESGAWRWLRLGSAFTRRPSIYDISAKDFLRLGPQYGWDFAGSEGWLYLDMQNALVDAAANGLIAVWGREVKRNFPASLLHKIPLVAIPTAHWVAGPNLNIPFNMKGELMQRDTESVTSESREGKERYEDLHLAKREAMRWARGSHAARFKGQHAAAAEKNRKD